jgi:aminocarboxymuconate-semialdehyde decarboxylase
MIIDTHFHGFPKGIFDRIGRAASASVRSIPIRTFDIDEYIQVLDKYEVDIGVLSLPSSHTYAINDSEQSRDTARFVNDTYAEACVKHPNRFKAFANLPMKYPEETLKEMERALDELKLDGVCIPTNVDGESLDEEKFIPFFEEANKRGSPVFMHPVNSPCEGRWLKFSFLQKIGWPTDSTLAIYRMAASGLFERFPQFPFIASHLGGAIAFYPDRLNWREGDLLCTESPEYYFKRIYYDTAGPVRSAAIKCVCDFAGADHVVFGSDYPFGREGKDDQFYSMTLEAMELLDVSKGDKEKIFHENAERIFKL